MGGRSAGRGGCGESSGVLGTAGERLAEGLAGQVVGVSSSALSLPVVALEGRQGLGVIGDVAGWTRQARAVVGQGVLEAVVSQCLANVRNEWENVPHRSC